MSRRYDFVLFGATGFTGRLTALYLAQHAPPQARWALAGRSADKLQKILAEVSARQPAGAAPVDVVVADVQDAQALRAVAESTRVIVTTVGPYILHGEPLVAACAAAGTHYLDLTGEPEFVDTMWMRHHDEAVRSAAKLVHACGFDSIPHDLGAYFTVRQLPRNVPIRMHAYVSARGTFSAGTYHSAVHAMSRMRSMARAARERTRAEMERAAKAQGTAASTGKRRVTGPVDWAIDGNELTAWGIDAGPGRRNQDRKAVFIAQTNVAFPRGTKLTFHLTQNHGGWNSDDNQNMNLGRFRISVSPAGDAVADPLPNRVREIISIPRAQRTPAQQASVFSHWRTTLRTMVATPSARK